jgi:hypothetical protein
MQRGHAALRAMAGKGALYEPRLNQLFAEPIVKQLMHRDRIDEAASLEQRRPRRRSRVACLGDGVTIASRHRYAWDIAVPTIRRRRD